MKISDIFDHKKRTFSFEFFPPKTSKAVSELYDALSELTFMNPDFVSVTYGAGGSTRQRTIDLVTRLKQKEHLNVMAHLTCVGHTENELKEILKTLNATGIDNILALRGDPPRGQTDFKPHAGGFRHAAELVTLIRNTTNACIGVAGYPEGHPESRSLDEDIEFLKKKVDAGADFVITQLFFDNHFYFDYVERCRKAGITCRLIPGIMPVTSLNQVARISELCNAHFPPGLLARLDKYRDDPAITAHIGLEHAHRQCRWLLDDGAPGIHFYTLNKSLATRHLLESLRY